MTRDRSEGPFRVGAGDPLEEKPRRQIFASKLLARAFIACNRYAARVAADLGIGEKKLRQMQNPADPMTIPLRDLVGLPEDMAVFIANEWMALYAKRVADLPIVTDEESASEFAREISQTSSGAISAILDESADAASKLKALRIAIGVYERAAAQLLRAEREANKVRPIKGSNGNGEH